MGIKKTLASLVLAGAMALGLGGRANAGNIDINITADNGYSIYVGDNNRVSEMIASVSNFESGNDIWSAESYLRDIADGSYLYIVASGDYNGGEGLLADINAQSKGKVLSGNSLWKVAATGLGNRNGAPPSLLELTNEIARANAGTNSSEGWVDNTPCPFTNEEGGIGQIIYNEPISIPDIDPNSRWMWYDSGRDLRQYSPFLGFNHDEYLIFRINTADIPELPNQKIPEPATLSLLALGGLGLLASRKKSKVD